MAPRIDAVVESFAALKIQPIAARSFSSTRTLPASTIAQKRRHQDPYALAQARARRAANLSRQEVPLQLILKPFLRRNRLTIFIKGPSNRTIKSLRRPRPRHPNTLPPILQHRPPHHPRTSRRRPNLHNRHRHAANRTLRPLPPQPLPAQRRSQRLSVPQRIPQRTPPPPIPAQHERSAARKRRIARPQTRT